jgi:hypothetical protein
MTAKMRSSGRAIYNLYTFVFAAHYEGAALKLSGVVDVYRLGESGHWPVLVNLTFAEPCRLIENGIQQAEAHRHARGRIHRHVKSGHDPREHVDGQGQPRAARHRRARPLVDNDDVDFGVIDLDHFKRTADRIFARPPNAAVRDEQTNPRSSASSMDILAS